jgi:hypothetical protein
MATPPLITINEVGNDLSGRQWRLDTATPFPQPGCVLWDANLFVREIQFLSYSSQGNLCILTDRNGRVVWYATGAADLSPVRIGDIGWVDGICLHQLDNAAGGTPALGIPPAGLGGSICVVYIK